MASFEPIRRDTPPVGTEIPDKLYFRIGEVARLCAVPAYVLRFWESEFPQLRPNKGGTGQRLFRRRDVEAALRIKRLLYEDGYTIPGARQILKGEQRQGEPQLPLAIEAVENAAPHPEHLPQLRRLREELASLHTLLSEPPQAGAEDLRTGNLRQSRNNLAATPPVTTDNLFDFRGSPADKEDERHG